MHHNTRITPKAIQTAIVVILASSILLPSCNGSIRGQNGVGDTGQTILTFADFSSLQNQYTALIEEFQAQHPSINVQFVPIDSEAGRSALDHQRIASLADVVVLPTNPLKADVPFYLDPRPYQESDATFNMNTFWPELMRGCQVEGRPFGLPIATQISLIYYDAAAFDEGGLPYPVPGWSWQDFENDARLLTGSGGEKATRYGFVDRGQPLLLLGPEVDAVLAEMGTSYDAGRLSQALDWYVSLARDGIIPNNSQEERAPEVETFIADRQAAMWVDNFASLSHWRQILGNGVGVTPFPDSTIRGVTQTTRARAKCAAISAGTVYPQAAWEWMQFLSTRAIFTGEPGSIPARRDVAEVSSQWKALDAQTQDVIRYSLDHAWYGTISTEPFISIGKAMDQAIVNSVPLSETLASIPVGETTPPLSPEITPLAVSTPQPTTAPLGTSDNTMVVRYFANPLYQTNLETLKPLAEAFVKDHPGFSVQLADAQSTFGNQGYGFDQIAQRFDCFAESAWGARVETNQLWSLGSLLLADPEGRSLLTDFPADLAAISQVSGELYALPVASQPTVLYYNKTLFSKMGLQPPAREWTLDDFWALVTSVAAEDTYGFVPLDGRGFIDFLLGAQGIQLYDLSVAPPEVNFDNPKVLNVVSTLADMYKRGVIPPIEDNPLDYTRGNYDQRFQYVQKGRAAMWMNLAGMDYGFYTTPEGPDFEVGVAPLPRINEPLMATNEVIGLYISRQVKDPSACWQWIKYLSAQPGAFQGIPARNSVLESPQLAEIIGPELAATYRSVMEQPRQEPDISSTELYPSYPLYVWWPGALASVFTGVPADQALLIMQQKAQTNLDCITIVKDPTQEDAWVACAQEADSNFRLPRDR